MTAQEIINSSNLNKTEKIIRLAQLGWTVQQICEAINSGYGFVWVVIKKRYPAATATATAWAADFNFNRKFGIEIEGYGVSMNILARKLQEAGVNATVEGYNHNTRNHWKIVTDGSLSGDNTFEIVSPVLEGEAGLAELEKVSEVLVALRVKINKSCGLHIHFDASAMNIQGWKNLYKNYIEFETTIDAFLPTSRRANNNSYCKSLTLGNSKTETFAKLDRCTMIQSLANLYSSRYFKINAQSYARHNTVEFRQHSGTIEFAKMKNWILFLDGLVKFSQSQVTTSGELEKAAQFCRPETMDYLHTRCQELAA
jgi:hypothetical protein